MASYCPQWRKKTAAFDDPCTVNIRERQSQDVGEYQTNNFFRRCGEPVFDDCTLNQTFTYPKVWGNVHQCNPNLDSRLRYAPLTDLNNINQLFTRPYAGAGYKGAGARSLGHKDIESYLQQGEYHPTFKSCEPTSGVYIDRWDYLPYETAPTWLSRTVESWTRGGVNTRELVKQLNYGDYCHMINSIKSQNKFWEDLDPKIA